MAGRFEGYRREDDMMGGRVFTSGAVEMDEVRKEGELSRCTG